MHDDSSYDKTETGLATVPRPEGSHPADIEAREPGIVLVLSLFTCGLYLIYWYYKMYEEIEQLSGETPTGQSFIIDFFLNLVTCTIYGIWVDYKISIKLHDMQIKAGHPHPHDSATAAVLLDVAAYITGFFTNYISSSLHQDQLNKHVRWCRENGKL